LRREGRANTRLAASAFDGSHQGGLFTAHKCPGAHAHLQVKAEVCTQDVLTQEPKRTRLFHCQVHGADSDGIFCAAVDIPLTGANRVGGNDHAFDDRVRIAFQHAPVHESAGVAFVRVADNIFDIAGSLTGEAPLETGGEASAAPAAQLGIQHDLNDLFRAHLGQYFAKRLVTVIGNVVFDIAGINHANVAQNNANLLGFRRAELLINRVLHFCGILLEDASFNKVLFDQAGNLIVIQVGIMRSFGVDDHIRTEFLRITQPWGLQNAHLVDEALFN